MSQSSQSTPAPSENPAPADYSIADQPRIRHEWSGRKTKSVYKDIIPGKWWSGKKMSYDRYNSVGRIMETDLGEQRHGNARCERCVEKDRECWTYSKAAEAQIRVPGSACARCRSEPAKCSLSTRGKRKNTADSTKLEIPLDTASGELGSTEDRSTRLEPPSHTASGQLESTEDSYTSPKPSVEGILQSDYAIAEAAATSAAAGMSGSGKHAAYGEVFAATICWLQKSRPPVHAASRGREIEVIDLGSESESDGDATDPIETTQRSINGSAESDEPGLKYGTRSAVAKRR
ncbi:uncharacterized protein BKA78DRAFT_383776 [Phyllosticta capitalensis]|uniref:uncharacterized protein n=1 Tax=Phyllosticta capitalensis TaxID=121624 RepID=UPI0031313BFC